MKKKQRNLPEAGRAKVSPRSAALKLVFLLYWWVTHLPIQQVEE
jgi:hypothetical protein